MKSARHYLDKRRRKQAITLTILASALSAGFIVVLLYYCYNSSHIRF